jgi:hypothetical protein
MRNPTVSLLLVALALAPAAAFAASSESEVLAAPGPCAEPRRWSASGACTDCGDPARSGFDVSGPARARFSPTDVAAGANEAPLPAPESQGFAGRGPCDVPGSGCTGPIAPDPGGPAGTGGNGGLTVVERPPKPGGPPGTTRRNSR